MTASIASWLASPRARGHQNRGSTSCAVEWRTAGAATFGRAADDGRHSLRLHDNHVAKILGEDEEWLREIAST